MRKNNVNLEILKRKNYKLVEIYNVVISCLIVKCKNESNILNLLILKKNQLYKKYIKSSIKNYCIFSRRARGVIRYFSVSRIFIREMAAKGLFFGVKKASW